MRGSQRVTQDIPILGHVNQDLLDQLAADGGPPIYTLTPDEARGVLLLAQPGSVRKPDAQVKDRNVDSGLRALRLHTIGSLERSRKEPRSALKSRGCGGGVG